MGPGAALGWRTRSPYGPLEVIRRQMAVDGGLEERFHDLTALVRETVATLGIDLGVGELPGEYCPGRLSLRLPGGAKVAGVAQRVIRGASLTTAALTVEGGPAPRAESQTSMTRSSSRSTPRLRARSPKAASTLGVDAVLGLMREQAAAGYSAPSGKIQRRALRERHWSDADRRVGG